MKMMSLRPLKFFKTNADLANYQNRGAAVMMSRDIRGRTPIAVIDDQPFSPEDNLRSYGYNFKKIGDIKSTEEVREFHIILCDLMDVGRYFDTMKQGASLIHEIRNQYPSILVIAYTGAAMNSVPAKFAKERADRLIRKDAEISEWVEILDDICQKACDPYFIWQRVRFRLIEMQIDTKSILLLEDGYVRSVEKSDPYGKQLSKRLDSLNISADARGVVQSLIASAIFQLFMV